MPKSDLDILANETPIGDDGQMPGISQPISLDEIRDVIFATDPVSARLEKLRQMKRDFQTRNMADTEGGFDAYITEIDRGIAELTGGADGAVAPGTLDEFGNAAAINETTALD